MANGPSICGKMTTVSCTTSTKRKGGEQGDALMPSLFALGQHAALVAVQSQLIVGEKLMAFLDDIYVVTRPERIGAVAPERAACQFRNPDLRWGDTCLEQWRSAPSCL